MASRSIRIGVVCEGQTDYIAISQFVGSSLAAVGIEADFLPIQPEMGASDDAGWTRVVFWLEQNPPASRFYKYFGNGLFHSSLSNKRCDVILIQMDSDILDDECFSNFMNKKSIAFNVPSDPVGRGAEIRRILLNFAQSDTMTDAERLRYIWAPAVEATETWCIAAFARMDVDPEILKVQDLWNEFGKCLAQSEGKLPNSQYGQPDKDQDRRRKYCEKHIGSKFLEAQSFHFREIINQIINYVSQSEA